MKQNTKIGKKNTRGLGGCKCYKQDLNVSQQDFDVPESSYVVSEPVVQQLIDVASSMLINNYNQADNNQGSHNEVYYQESDEQNSGIATISNIQANPSFSSLMASKNMQSMNELSVIGDIQKQPLTPESPTTTMLSTHKLRQVPTEQVPSCRQILQEIQDMISATPNTIKNQVLSKLLTNIQTNENSYQKYVLTIITYRISQLPEEYILEHYLDYNQEHICQFIDHIMKNLYWQKNKHKEDDQVQTLVREALGFTFLNRAINESFIYDNYWCQQLFNTMNSAILVAPHFKYDNDFIMLRNTSTKEIINQYDVNEQETAEFDAVYCIHKEHNIGEAKIKFRNLVVYSLGNVQTIQLFNTSNLVSLSLSWCSVSGQMNLENLKSLALFNVKQWEPDSLISAIQLENVYINTVSNNKITYIGDQIIKNLANSSKLKNLYIFSCDMRRKVTIDFLIQNLKVLAIYSPRSDVQKVVIKVDKANPKMLELVQLNYCDNNSHSLCLEIKGEYPENLIFVQEGTSKK